MITILHTPFAAVLMTGLLASCAGLCLGAQEPPNPSASVEGDGTCRIENTYLGRTIVVRDGPLRTTAIANKRAGTTAVPTSCNEFELRLSAGTDKPDTAVTLRSADFEVLKTTTSVVHSATATAVLSVLLENKPRGLTVEVRYELGKDDFYLRKYLRISSAQPVTLERIDVESLAFEDAQQPYTTRALTAQGKWSPGLGEPLYGTKSGTFWGVEFPASDNLVKDHTLHCGYLWGRERSAGSVYQTYPAVMGVADNARYVQDAFFAYIDRIRIRPLRLQVQYNSWFDYGGGVNKDNFKKSVEQIHQKLVTERGNRPFQAYVIDDGWQDTGKDWSQKVWQVNGKFAPDFASCREATRNASSTLGLWLSPGCLFGAQGAVDKLRAGGCEALEKWMSLAGPKYMQLLEDRMVELTRQGVTYFKLDGLFGHLNTREFELRGERYGLPKLPQLGLEGLKPNDRTLNDSKYDELKIYYLTAGTERLMQVFRKMAEANPNVYIVISNGAYLSSWWLMYVDSIWMINAGDAASGTTRTQELVYRDDRYHEIWQKEQTPFPMHAIFNHEPKKLNSSEPKEVFRKYLYMSLSRGTGFVELYIKPSALKDYDWDVISEGLYWTYEVFPAFRRSRLHGGSPKAGEVYGYTGWTETLGYVSIHNPADKPQRYSLTLDRDSGLVPGSGPFLVSSPIEECTKNLKAEYAFGDSLVVELQPREIRILNFDKARRDWKTIRDLQTRTEGPPLPSAQVPIPVGNHPVLGVWSYQHAGNAYTRTFTADGFCTLKEGEKEIWRKPFAIDDAKTVTVEGGFRHTIKDKDTLDVEGRYQATRRP
jgi:hypothetical protein